MTTGNKAMGERRAYMARRPSKATPGTSWRLLSTIPCSFFLAARIPITASLPTQKTFEIASFYGCIRRWRWRRPCGGTRSTGDLHHEPCRFIHQQMPAAMTDVKTLDKGWLSWLLENLSLGTSAIGIEEALQKSGLGPDEAKELIASIRDNVLFESYKSNFLKKQKLECLLELDYQCRSRLHAYDEVSVHDWLE